MENKYINEWNANNERTKRVNCVSADQFSQLPAIILPRLANLFLCPIIFIRGHNPRCFHTNCYNTFSQEINYRFSNQGLGVVYIFTLIGILHLCTYLVSWNLFHECIC